MPAEPDPQHLIAEARRRQSRRMAVIGLLLSFGPLIFVLIVLALRDSSSTLTPATALVLLAVIVLGPLIGFAFVVASVRRSRDG